VYEQRLKGEAELARATQQRQILVQQAMAEREAAEQRAQAIKIVGQAAKDFPEYRQQEFIGSFAEALKDGKINQIIYVPTEANIPIIERKAK
jgi:regulator of protease activity HflC (stomatin/prohibitin superfamily)